MDQEYWDRFYKKRHPNIETPSSFALKCAALVNPGELMMELGCGNGRDAFFFARLGLRVVACDQSSVAIGRLSEKAAGLDVATPPEFVCASFSELRSDWAEPFQIVYSRFTLHAVPPDEASRALAWSFEGLDHGGHLLIEARSVKGDLYGKGKPAGRDAFIFDGHYRRFLRSEELLGELEGLGFVVREHSEAAGVAVHGDDDPVVIRATVQKP